MAEGFPRLRAYHIHLYLFFFFLPHVLGQGAVLERGGLHTHSGCSMCIVLHTVHTSQVAVRDVWETDNVKCK